MRAILTNHPTASDAGEQADGRGCDNAISEDNEEIRTGRLADKTGITGEERLIGREFDCLFLELSGPTAVDPLFLSTASARVEAGGADESNRSCGLWGSRSLYDSISEDIHPKYVPAAREGAAHRDLDVCDLTIGSPAANESLEVSLDEPNPAFFDEHRLVQTHHTAMVARPNDNAAAFCPNVSERDPAIGERVGTVPL